MANTMTLIASSTVGSGGAANITFSSIASTYTDLLIKVSARTTDTSGNWTQLYASFNGTSVTTNWTNKSLYGLGTAASSYTSTSNELGWAVAANATANTFSNTDVYIPNYAGSNNKSMASDGVTENNAASALIILDANTWANTSAITSITITPSTGTLVQYSTAYLYGVKNA
jgi:hypothetical protein